MEDTTEASAGLSKKPADVLKRNIKWFIIIVGIVFALLLFTILLASLNNARGLSVSSVSSPPMSSSNRGKMSDGARMGEAYAPSYIGSYEYVPNLEQYETSDYTVTARTRAFEAACEKIIVYKSDTQIHFKSFSEQQNQCSAFFFVPNDRANQIADDLQTISGAEVTRTVTSVTRDREILKSESEMITEQLRIVEQTLADAERQYSEITQLAQASNNASALSEAITNKLTMIEMLNQKRIDLTARLGMINRSAAELNERINVTAFTVTITRSFVLDTNRTTLEWEGAWRELREQWTSVLIGLSAYLGIFVIRTIQYAVYALIIIVIARFVWKIAQKVWKL